MNKIYALLIGFLWCFSNANAQTLIPTSDEIILPSYAYYGGTSVGIANRMPFVSRLTLSGLTPGATYRYVTGMSSNNALNTMQAPGNMYRINNGTNVTYGNITGLVFTKAINSSEIQNDIMNTSNTAFHGRFVADVNGNYTGWFATVPVGNLTQQANGSDVYFYIGINDGATGVTLARSYRTSSTIKLLNYSSVPGDVNGCTALLGTSDVGDEKIVTIYDNTASTGRPLYCTFTENNNNGGALNEGTIWSNPQIYAAVDGVSGKWAAIIPNNLTGGVRAINFLNIADASPITLSNAPAPNTSADGTWNGVSTANPAGDSTASININSIASSVVLPVKLLSFNGVATKEGIALSWTTTQETNNNYFELKKAGNNNQFTSIATIAGHNNSQINRTYNFVDKTPFTGTNLYQLWQVDFDGNKTAFNIISLKYGARAQQIRSITATANELRVVISLAEAITGNIVLTDLSGRVFYNKRTSLMAGENNILIPVQLISRQVTVVSFVTATERTNMTFIK